MAEQFYTILTNIGKAKIANSLPTGQKLNLVKMKIGDGNGKYYNPSENQTDLVHKIYECNVTSVEVDEDNPQWITITSAIPSDIGGFSIREVGVFDDTNSLIAVGKYPETYKPVAADGSTKELYIKMTLEVSNAASVELKIDPTVILATKKDISILDARIENNTTQLNDIAKKSVFKPGLSRPMQIAHVNSNTLEPDYINKKVDLVNYIQNNMINFGIKKAHIVIQTAIDKNNKLFISYNNKEFSNWQDSFTYLLNLIKENDIELLFVKIHTTVGLGGITLEQITNTCGIEQFKVMYVNILNELCTFFKQYTDKCVILNERNWIYLDSEYTSFVLNCFNTVKSHGMKVSISTVNPCENQQMPQDIKDNIDFLCTNYYPPLSYNGMNASLEKMIQRVISADDYKYGLPYILSTGKEVYISETGCVDRYEGLAEPWKYSDWLNPTDRKGEVQKRFLEIIFELLNNERILDVCYWFDLNVNTKPIIKEMLGGI